MLNYQEYKPSPDLNDFIECYWLVWPDPKSAWNYNRPLLPDGCVDVLFHLSGYAEYRKAKQAKGILRKTAGTVLGTQTGPFHLKPIGETVCLGVRFLPGAASFFLPVSIADLTDRFLPLEDVLGKIAQEIEEPLFEPSSIPHRIDFLENELRKKIASAPPSRHRFSKAVDLVLESKGQTTVENLCEQTGVTRQHLSRLFQKKTGLKPKKLCRVIRFQEILRQLETEDKIDWCSLALEAGYYDQSHFISEFTEFTGTSPSQYLSQGFHKFHFSNTTLPFLE